MMHSRFTYVSAVLTVLLCISQFYSYGQARQLQILSWNVQLLPSIAFYKGQMKRAPLIVNKLKDSNYDVIVFQEAFHNKARKLLWKGLIESFPYQLEPGKGGFLKFNSGVWIISKLKLERTDNVKFTKCRIPLEDCRANKGASFVEVIKDGLKVQIFATHVQAREGEKYQQTRNSQFQEMKNQLIEKYKEEKVPQIVLGDLNTSKSKTEDYSNMLVILDAEDGRLAGELQYTYDGILNDMGGSPNKKVIDYILINKRGNPDVKLNRNVIIFQEQWSKKNVDLSDHYAVECKLIY